MGVSKYLPPFPTAERSSVADDRGRVAEGAGDGAPAERGTHVGGSAERGTDVPAGGSEPEVTYADFLGDEVDDS